MWSNLYFYWQRYASSQWSKCCGLMRSGWVSPYQLWKYALLWHTLLLLRPITKPHFNLFFTTISRSKRIFFPEGELKKEFQLTHVCKQCCGALIDNARLVAFLELEFSLPSFQLYMLSCKWCICKAHDSINREDTKFHC